MAKSTEVSANATGLVRNLQVLRAASALMIVIAHLDVYLTPMGASAYHILSLGIAGTAIGLFFVISGFIMVHTTIGRHVTPWTFMANRVSRIVPLYWTLTLIVFGVAFFTPALLKATSADWTALVKSLAFVPFTKSNGMTEPILFVGWTLNLEMLFYLVFAVSLGLKDRNVGVLSSFVFLVCLVTIGPAVLPGGPVSEFYTSSIILEFGLGMLVGLMTRRAPGSVTILVKALAVIVILISLALSMFLPSAFPAMPWVFACGIPTSLIVGGAILLERWGWSIKSALWLLLGDASYSIYLSHPFVTQLISKVLPASKMFGVVNLSIIALALVLVCVVGVVIYHMLELPMLHLSRRLVRPQRLQGSGTVSFRPTSAGPRVHRPRSS